MLQKMCSRQADIRTVQQHIYMALVTALAVLLSRLHTCGMTIQTILGALLHFHLTQRLSCILCHYVYSLSLEELSLISARNAILEHHSRG